MILTKELINKEASLSEEQLKKYNGYKNYLSKRDHDNIEDNIVLSHLIDDLDTIPDNNKEAFRTIKKNYPIKKEVKEYYIKTLENQIASLLICVMTSYIFCLFLKELLSNRYLIHLYVDSAIAVVAFFVMIQQLRALNKLYKLTNVKRRSYIITLLSILISAFINLFIYQSPFDFTFIILVIGAVFSKRIYTKEINEKI